MHCMLILTLLAILLIVMVLRVLKIKRDKYKCEAGSCILIVIYALTILRMC